MKKLLKVFIICSGLGHVKRGFESFSQECFDTLSKGPTLDITLFKGGGNSYKKEISLWNLPRNNWITIQLGKLSGRGAYFTEQKTFFVSLIPYLYREQPDIIYFSDGTLGNLLWHWRLLTKQSYKLLFSNGGPLSPPFLRWDHVQQVTPIHLQAALDAGTPTEKQSLVPYGIQMPSELQALTLPERESLRHKLGLPEDRPLILSVGTINKSHKRMDYIIQEVASLPKPRPYLLLLGQQDSESPEIIQLGNRLLGSDHFQIRTVNQQEVADYYRIADAFILASLGEGFGRVFLEAMSHGLPCLAHDYEVTRFVLGKDGYLANFEFTGSLAGLIRQVLAEGHEQSKRHLRHRHVYKHFSWERLRASYVEMIQRCAVGTDPARSLIHSNVTLRHYYKHD